MGSFWLKGVKNWCQSFTELLNRKYVKTMYMQIISLRANGYLDKLTLGVHIKELNNFKKFSALLHRKTELVVMR